MPVELRGRIAFASGKSGDYDLWTLDLEDGAYRQLTATHSWNDKPAWSPDGGWISYTSNVGGFSEIYRVASEGGEPEQITSTGRWCDCPAYSPDGATIAYVSNVAGNNDVWLMDADGRNPRRITTYEGSDGHVCWTPDGGSLIWSSDRDLGDADLWQVELDSGVKTQLTGAYGADIDPSVSPDGRFVAFVSNRAYRLDPENLHRDRDKDIYLQELASGECVRLTESQGADAAPTWSPDGDMILYTAGDDHSSGRLRLLNVGEVIAAMDAGDRREIERAGDRVRTERLDYDRAPLENDVNAVRHATFITAWLPNRMLEGCYPPNYFGHERNPAWFAPTQATTGAGAASHESDAVH